MKFGITQPFPCNYLSNKDEQLLVHIPVADVPESKAYDKLIHSGFRRSGEQIYRPHCAQCNACQSIRVLTYDFKPTKSQKRVLRKNQDLKMVVNDANVSLLLKDTPDYFDLYARYISERHQDGSMYPPNKDNFVQFLSCEWQSPILLEAWLDNALIAVAVTDLTVMGLSAFYTYFAPEYDTRSLGTFMILQQIRLSQSKQKPYLFLGYQIDECQKMSYKTKYHPYERFNGEFWVPNPQ
jgi:arginine-tRNA-protein transferase